MALRGSLDFSPRLHRAVALVKYVPDRMPRPSSRAPQSCLRRRVEGGEAETPVPSTVPREKGLPSGSSCLSGGATDVHFPFGRL